MSFTESITDLVAKNSKGVLGRHPSWRRIPLSEVAKILNGYPFASERFNRDKGMPLIRIRDVRNTQTDAFYDGPYDSAYIVRPGELLVGMDGDFHCSLWKGPPALLNQRVCKITVTRSDYDHRFLAYVLPGYLNAINAATPSLTVKHLSSKTVAEIPLPMPPLNEQRRIVAELDRQFTRLDAAHFGLRRTQANLKRYRTSVLQAAFDGALIGDGRAGWRRVPLGDLIAEGPQNGLYLPQTAYGRGEPIIRIDDYQFDSSRSSSELRRVDADAAMVASYSLRAGDILINRVNSPTHLGKCLAITSRHLPALFESNMMRFRLKESCRPAYLVSYLESRGGRAELTKNAKWAVNQASINQQDVARTPVPLPTPQEQDAIVAEIDRRLSVAQSTAAIVTAKLREAARLRQSILQRAFEGKL